MYFVLWNKLNPHAPARIRGQQLPKLFQAVKNGPLETVKRRENGASLATEVSTKRRDSPSTD
jgi:hypothetical protein